MKKNQKINKKTPQPTNTPQKTPPPSQTPEEQNSVLIGAKNIPLVTKHASFHVYLFSILGQKPTLSLLLPNS